MYGDRSYTNLQILFETDGQVRHYDVYHSTWTSMNREYKGFSHDMTP